MITLSGKVLAAELRLEVTKEVRVLKEAGIQPCLAVCVVGDDPASHIYVTRKQKACAEVGILSLCRHFPADIDAESILSLIRDWNRDERVHGILVQLPLPSHVDRFTVVNAVSPDKDVDGFHALNLGRLVHNRPSLVPCTPAAVQRLLAHYKIDTDGKLITVVNRGIVVGQPLALLLMQDAANANATVTVCHDHTRNLKDVTRGADIIVTAVGKRPGFVLSHDMVRGGQAIIDLGVSRIDGKIYGDVDLATVSQIVDYVTPPVGGVGPVTVAMLMKNTVLAAADLYWMGEPQFRG